MEEQRRIEDEKNVPEFVRVKENLRHIQLTQQNWRIWRKKMCFVNCT